jgi:hypothetical protein
MQIVIFYDPSAIAMLLCAVYSEQNVIFDDPFNYCVCSQNQLKSDLLAMFMSKMLVYVIKGYFSTIFGFYSTFCFISITLLSNLSRLPIIH